jgi:O-antigen/teichoic acid export membrane protein
MTNPLTSSRLLARNTAWNLLGNGAPMIVAVFSIPILITGLGKDRFGVLALAWALIGYAGLFDLGLGRALTQLVAQKLGVGQDREVPMLVWTSLALMLILGLVGTVVIMLATPLLVQRTLNVPVALQRESLRAFYLLGLCVPLVITTAGLRGLLEAYQHFRLTNVLRIPMGVFTFVGPLLVLPFSRSLFPVVAVLVAGRLVAWAAHLVLCLRVMPALRKSVAWERAAVGPLLRFGGWMTVSNVVSPLMVTLDRFLIGAVVSMTAVAYYATPYEVVTKFLFIPSALMGVMFPAFSTSFVRDRARTALLYGRCVKYLFLILFPVVLLTVGLAKNGLAIWLGADFAAHSFRVLQWLAVGVFLNSLAQVPFALVQGVGRPDLTAKLHLIELPFYLLGLWWLISTYGIEGVAIAWTVRMALDTLALFCFSSWLLPESVSASRYTVSTVAVALAVLLSASLPTTPIAKMIFLSCVLLAFISGGWFLALAPDERALIGARLKPSQVSFHAD